MLGSRGMLLLQLYCLQMIAVLQIDDDSRYYYQFFESTVLLILLLVVVIDDDDDHCFGVPLTKYEFVYTQ